MKEINVITFIVDIAGSLKNLLADSDATVRQKSTECLFVIAGNATQAHRTFNICIGHDGE